MRNGLARQTDPREVRINATPLVSVVMSAYNCESSIGAAIDSVLAQTYSRLELIVVDDASTDATARITAELAARDSRITVVSNARNSHRGPIEWEARNDGLRVASGEYVAYLDADNRWEPGFVERLASCLRAEPGIQLVCCRSRNYYSPDEAAVAVATDPRQLVASGPGWTVFGNGELARDRLGVDQYVDTNELMHRASALGRLTGLWNTQHPRRDQVQRQLRSLRRYRRHNDLDLVERIVDAFGIDSVRQLEEVLVHYHYDRPAGAALTAEPSNPLHPQLKAQLGSLNVEHFYSGYATPRPRPSGYDLGLGEIEVPGLNLDDAFEAFAGGGGARGLLTRYNGSAQVAKTLALLAEHYGRVLGLPDLDERHLVAFDGCHEALSAAIGLFTGTTGNARDTVAFAVPSYPYWTIAAAGRHRSHPVTAYSVAEYLDELERLPGEAISAVILNWPNNPLGYSGTAEQVRRLNALAAERGWGIVADVTYQQFLGGGRHPLAALAPERTVWCESAAKAWGLPGLRLGFAIAADPALTAVLRAVKSGRSLLPAAVKVAFLAWLLTHRPEVPDRIVAAAHSRRHRFRQRWQAGPPVPGVALAGDVVPGLYEVLHLDPAAGRASAELADVLWRAGGVRTFARERFFPPGAPSRSERDFLRVSLGMVDEVEGAVEALLDQLHRSRR